MKKHDVLGYKLSVCEEHESNVWIWTDNEKTYSSYDEACKDAEAIRNTEHKAVHVIKYYVNEEYCRFYPAKTHTYEEYGVSHEC